MVQLTSSLNRQNLHLVLCQFSTWNRWLFGLFLCLQLPFVKAQHLEFEWSEKERFSNFKDGFFSKFIETNENNIYVLQTNEAATHPYEQAKVRLAVYNKYSMAFIHAVPVKGFRENKAQRDTYKELDYLSTIVHNEKVYVFWRKLINSDSLRLEELYVQTFKSELEPDLPLSKVFTSEQPVDVHASDFSPTKFVILSDKMNERLVIGTEICSKEYPVFHYTLLDANCQIGAIQQISLPQETDSLTQGLSSTYELGTDGFVYIRSVLKYTSEELDQLSIKHSKTYLSVVAVRTETGESSQFMLRAPEKTITDFSFAPGFGSSRILGFFGDLKKDPSGVDKQGLFYVDMHHADMRFSDLNFTYFEKASLNKLFPRSKGGRRKNVEEPSPEEILQTRFDIERLIPMEDSSYILFFTRKYNYTEITAISDLNGENLYTRTNFCEKNNVCAIRLTASGKIRWTSSIERNKTYRGTDVSDLRVITRFDKIFVVYGNDLLAKGGKQKVRTEEDTWTSELSYAIFDPNTGRGKPYTTPVNPEKTAKKDLKYIQPNSAVVFDEQIYFHQMVMKQNPWWIVANVLCFPTLYYTFNTGNTKMAKGDMTVATIIEGKKRRR